jgi:hypothetical protein
MSFTYCSGYRCGKKDECLRNQRHKKLKEQKVNTKGMKYIVSTLCVRHRHNNFVPGEIYGEDDA